MTRLSKSSRGHCAGGVALRDGKLQLISLQRRRMISAAAAVFGEGVTRLTVTHVISRARVSRKTFYEIFDDAEDCFLATFEDAVERATQVASVAFADKPSWRAGTRAAVAALLEMVEREPGLARMCVVDAPSAGERVLTRYTEVVQELAAAIDTGRDASRTASSPQPMTAQAVAGGILALLHDRLLQDMRQPVVGLTGPVMSTIVMPYFGRG